MKKNLLVILWLFCCSLTFAQNDLSPKEIRKNRPAFITLGYGMGGISFRDFATSPLTYSGIGQEISLGFLKQDQKLSAFAQMNIINGSGSIQIKNESSSSQFTSVELQYSRLYTINPWSSENWNLSAGGLLDLTTNFRINESLQNNALGIEMFGSLFGSFQVKRDISRKRTKHIDFLFIHKTFDPKTRNLFYRLNIGLINHNLRNGYIYNNQSQIINDPNAFEDYKLNKYDGLRFGSSFIYSRVFKNKNIIQFTYDWSATTTGGNSNVFEMAHHIVKCTLLFNTK